MQTAVVFIHVIVAVILVLTVLLQAGKGAGMGAAFGGSSSSVFGSRGPATLISKITCAAAVVFMVTSLNLAIAQGGRLAKGSVMDSWKTEDAVSTVLPEAEITPVPTTDAAPMDAAIKPEPSESAVSEKKADDSGLVPGAAADEAAQDSTAEKAGQ